MEYHTTLFYKVKTSNSFIKMNDTLHTVMIDIAHILNILNKKTM